MAVQEDQKIQVQQATDIVRLIGEQVSLRPKGKEFAGLCPFHDDKNPSMFVSPAKQIYKCFSCGAGGDVFTFVTQYHKMTFPEALSFLAERAGIRLEARGGRGGGEAKQGERGRISQANTLAVGFFRALYRHAEHGRSGREYVAKRGISPEMVEAFEIGYAPDRWDGLSMTIAQKNWDLGAFELAGLVKARERGGEPASGEASGHYDRLRHRLIFPIFDAIGRPIAFGGRKLREADEPKYLNSPETALFNKSATLYGLHLAKKPIIDSRTAVIVEGYTDVIACHQAGVRNVVATLGTALTAEHVRELRRYAEQVVLVFDGDAAGQKAADRAVELFLTSEVDVSIAVLGSVQGGSSDDPADVLSRPGGLEQWQASMAGAKDALAYQFERVREQLGASETVSGRQRVAETYLRGLAQLGLEKLGPLRRGLVYQRLASVLSLSESAVSGLLSEYSRRGGRVSAAGEGGGSGQGVGSSQLAAPEGVAAGNIFDADGLEIDVAWGDSRHKLRAIELAQHQLIGCLLRRNELFHHVLPDGRSFDETVTPGEFVTDAERELYERIYERLSNSGSMTLANLLGELASEDRTDLASAATSAEMLVDRASADDAERVGLILSSAAQALLAYHEAMNYQRRRAVVSEGKEDEKVQAAESLFESLRERPSSVRIARPRQ